MDRMTSWFVTAVVTAVLIYICRAVPPIGVAYYSNANNLYVFKYALLGFFPLLVIGYAIGRNYFIAPIVIFTFYKLLQLRWERLLVIALALLAGSILLFLIVFAIKKIRNK